MCSRDSGGPEVAETSERVRQFLLVIVEQSGVWDDDEGLAEAEDVYDGAGAWGRGEVGGRAGAARSARVRGNWQTYLHG